VEEVVEEIVEEVVEVAAEEAERRWRLLKLASNLKK
jgi:hypothetical protein